MTRGGRWAAATNHAALTAPQAVAANRHEALSSGYEGGGRGRMRPSTGAVGE